MRIRSQTDPECMCYPRFAYAGFPGQEHNTALAALGLLPPAQQQFEFLVAPHKW